MLSTTRTCVFYRQLFIKMCSFRQAREAAILAYDSSFIDEDEFVLLYDMCHSKNPELPYQNYESFELDNIDEAECEVQFRFKKHEVPVLARAMGVPGRFTCPQGTICDGMEALCILLRRFCYPCRYSDLVSMFGRPIPELSMITNQVVDFMYDQHAHRLTQWNDQLLSPQCLRRYAEAVARKGGALANCFGFIDGTVRAICRPGQMQRLVYNGHKRVHALKFQALALPNGLIGNLFGPVGMFHRYIYGMFTCLCWNWYFNFYCLHHTPTLLPQRLKSCSVATKKCGFLISSTQSMDHDIHTPFAKRMTQQDCKRFV